MKRSFLPYDPGLTAYARKLRNNSTLSEVLLWKELKGKQMMGFDFHRQKPLDRFIVDFYCPRLKLAIEIDGDSHAFKGDQDTERQRWLEERGIRFLRFGDLDVKFRMDDVVTAIRTWVKEHESEAIPSTPPQPRRPRKLRSRRAHANHSSLNERDQDATATNN